MAIAGQFPEDELDTGGDSFWGVEGASQLESDGVGEFEAHAEDFFSQVVRIFLYFFDTFFAVGLEDSLSEGGAYSVGSQEDHDLAD